MRNVVASLVFLKFKKNYKRVTLTNIMFQTDPWEKKCNRVKPKLATGLRTFPVLFSLKTQNPETLQMNYVSQTGPYTFHLELDPETKAKNEAEINQLRAALAYDMQIRSNNTTYFDKLYDLLPKPPDKDNKE